MPLGILTMPQAMPSHRSGQQTGCGVGSKFLRAVGGGQGGFVFGVTDQRHRKGFSQFDMVGIEPKDNDEVYLRSVATEEVPVEVGMRVDPSGNGSGEVEELADA